MAKSKTKTKETPKEERELLSPAEYAKRKGVSRQSVYNRLNTPETPNGDIIPELVKNLWKIDFQKYQNLEFKPVTRRTKVAPGQALNSETKKDL